MMGPQKRTIEEAGSLLCGVNAIVFDIEGTTTPISFVKDTLFPYARKNLEAYLTKNFEVPDVQKAVTALRDLANKEKEEKVEGLIEIVGEEAAKEDVIKSVCSNVHWQMDGDRKTKELKVLQGMIWKDAYESKELKGELFEDVGPMLKMLSAEDKKLYIFSSGSVDAQKLLFTHSSYGDLTEVISGYFDLNTGSKREGATYEKIAGETKNHPNQVLFLTDIPEEAEAAHSIGMRTALVIRPGNEELTDESLQNFACIERFDELYGDDDDEDDIKRFAGDIGEADDDEDDDDEVDEEDEEGDGENEDDEDNPDDAQICQQSV